MVVLVSTQGGFHLNSSEPYETLADGVFVSKLKGQSLQEYIVACHDYCTLHHILCEECPRMINAAKIVLEKSICTLSSVFQAAFPGVTYTAHNAKRRLLQLPLAAIRVHEASSGRSAVHLMEYMVGINYIKVAHHVLANMLHLFLD